MLLPLLNCDTESLKYLSKSSIKALVDSGERLRSAHEGYQHCSAVIRKETGQSNELPSADRLVRAMYLRWLEGICKEIANIFTHDGHLVLERDALLRLFPNLAPGVLVNFTGSVKDALNALFGALNFNILDDAIAQIVSKLEEQSFVDAADTLSLHLYLYHGANGWEKRLKTVKGKIELELGYTGWIHNRLERWKKMQAVPHTFENESGVKGLSDFFETVHAMEAEIGSDAGMESRTKINSEGIVHGVAFNEKIKLYLPVELFEALYGFLQTYARREITKVVLS